MPRLPADIRISLKKRGGSTHRIALIRQPVETPQPNTPPVYTPFPFTPPPGFLHAQVMATLNSRSTDAEVLAAYDDNASYEEDGNRGKANAFITACRILRNRLPLSAGRGSQTFTPAPAGRNRGGKSVARRPARHRRARSGRVCYASVENFRG